MKSFTAFVDHQLVMEARDISEYVEDRMGKYNRCANKILKVLEKYEIDPTELGGLNRTPFHDWPENVVKASQLFIPIFSKHMYGVDDDVEDAKSCRNALFAASRAIMVLGSFKSTINAEAKFAIKALTKNTRVEWWLDWAEYLVYTNTVIHSKAFEGVSPEIVEAVYGPALEKVKNKIEKKYDITKVSKNELSTQIYSLHDYFTDNLEDLETILRKDPFTNPPYTPSELISLIQNRMVETDTHNILETIKKMSPALAQDATTIRYIMEVFNKDEEIAEDNLEDALYILNHILTSVRPSVRDLRSASRYADELHEFFNAFYPDDDDVDAALSVGLSMEWVVESGSETDERFHKHMDNCGSDSQAEEMFSLCQVLAWNNHDYYYSVVTASTRDGTLLQMHGYNNAKPGREYHDEIYAFLKRYISEIDYSEAHAADDCFELSDLPEHQRNSLDISMARTDSEKINEMEEYLDSHINSERGDTYNLVHDEISISTDLTLPSFLDDFSMSYDEYDVENGYIEIKTTQEVRDYDGEIDELAAEYALEKHEEKFSNIDMDEIIGDFFNEVDDDKNHSPYRILQSLQLMGLTFEMQTEKDKVAIVPTLVFSRIALKPIEGDVLDDIGMRHIWSNRPKDLPDQADFKFPKQTGVDTGNTYLLTNNVIKSLKVFVDSGELEAFVNQHVKQLPKDKKDDQMMMKFESRVRVLLESVVTSSNFRLTVKRSGDYFKVSLHFPAIEYHDDEVSIRDTYKPLMRTIYTINENSTALLHEICVFLNAEVEDLPENLVFQPMFASRKYSPFETRRAEKQNAELQAKNKKKNE